MAHDIRTSGKFWKSRGTARLAVLALIAPVAFAPAAAQAQAPTSMGGGTNAVIAWDVNAQTAIYEVARQQPYVTSRSFAMVQGAVYDAVNAIAGSPYEPYLAAPRAHRGDSVDAAVASSAYQVLLSLFPEQADSLLVQYDASLAAIPDGRSKQGGIAVGDASAATMIAARANDGAFGNGAWVVGTQPGQWRPTPPAYAQDGAWVGDLKPFAIPSATMFRTSGPPALTSAAYAKDLNEVETIGSATSTVRTADQTEAARWWHDRRLTEWAIKRQIATNERLDTLQTARLFAMVDITLADASVACFNEKKFWSFWRPITAIQLADTDGNPATTADPAWTPLLITPPFPDYTSGHACATASDMTAMRHFFGRDDISFSAYSADSGTTRSYDSFSSALAELIEARIWGGIHFRTADVQGAKIGEGVARYVYRHELQPRR